MSYWNVQLSTTSRRNSIFTFGTTGDSNKQNCFFPRLPSSSFIWMEASSSSSSRPYHPHFPILSLDKWPTSHFKYYGRAPITVLRNSVYHSQLPLNWTTYYKPGITMNTVKPLRNYVCQVAFKNAEYIPRLSRSAEANRKYEPEIFLS